MIIKREVKIKVKNKMYQCDSEDSEYETVVIKMNLDIPVKFQEKILTKIIMNNMVKMMVIK